MDSKPLRRKCIQLYGRKHGKSLFKVMMAIHEKDFCVATAWTDRCSLSISLSCTLRGRVFRLTPDYGAVIMPDRDVRTIEGLSYEDIAKHLPHSGVRDERYQHCCVDRR